MTADTCPSRMLPAMALRAATTTCLLGWLASSCSTAGDEPHPNEVLAELAALHCDALKRCECTKPGCFEGPSWFDPTLELATSLHLEFDLTCAQSWLGPVQQLACDATFDLVDLALRPPSCEHPCALFFGERGLREPCQSTNGLSDCARGLACIEGECLDPCDDAPPSEGDACQWTCADGLWCRREQSEGVCLPLPTPGEPCTPHWACASEAWCDFEAEDDPTCVTRLDDGASCSAHTQCNSGHCPDGRCRSRLREGEPCSSNLRCAEGLWCPATTCERRRPALCR